MKTATLYIALLISSIWTFNACAHEVMYLDSAITYIKKYQGLQDKRLVDACHDITDVGRTTIPMRNEGKSLKYALDQFNNSINALENEHRGMYPRYLYLEISRMIRTVYRHPTMDNDQYNEQFMTECIVLDGY